MRNQSLLTPTSLPRSGVKDEELLVYWEDSSHHRSRTSNLTPLKPKPKRDSTAAGIPSPSKTVIDVHSSPSNGLPQAPLALSTASESRRSLRQHKRLRDRQSLSDGKAVVIASESASNSASSTPRPNPEIDVLLNRLAERVDKTKAKACGQSLLAPKRLTKSPSRTPTKTTPILPRVLASTTNTNNPHLHKRTPDNRSPKLLLGTTVSKPGLKPNAHTLQTSNRAPLKVTSLALQSKAAPSLPKLPLNSISNPPSDRSVPLTRTSRPTVSTTNGPARKPPNTNSVNPANGPRLASVAKAPPPSTKNPTAISRVPAKVPPPVPKVTTAAGPKILPRVQPLANPVKTNFNKTNVTTMKPFTTKTPVIAPTITKTTKITPITRKTTTTTSITSPSINSTTKSVQHHHDESISLLSGLCAGDLDWDLDD
ncbi:uncharacterized protein MELLADRAFT_116726 [Melampsora larici-populina 98AG31]|uniref:Uncharacterized protein n=1 Tax=Melampsora larici-populina (strain 98AG31 / pathotype 3-4-7) TaxID=747676 RepID=F4RPD9_MELLP|nr:uncharacterized protein MELLADRAFT_116726 [Melampsora larici-populina 98AG31]EGG05866.1 hypothetical protein MELLADRAFT_116726 [Melampsora larici-populina 98AG31]